MIKRFRDREPLAMAERLTAFYELTIPVLKE